MMHLRHSWERDFAESQPQHAIETVALEFPRFCLAARCDPCVARRNSSKVHIDSRPGHPDSDDASEYRDGFCDDSTLARG